MLTPVREMANLEWVELRKFVALGRPKSQAGSCDPQGHHAFGKYLILFMIIYMVKIGLVL